MGYGHTRPRGTAFCHCRGPLKSFEALEWQDYSRTNGTDPLRNLADDMQDVIKRALPQALEDDEEDAMADDYQYECEGPAFEGDGIFG